MKYVTLVGSCPCDTFVRCHHRETFMPLCEARSDFYSVLKHAMLHNTRFYFLGFREPAPSVCRPIIKPALNSIDS